MFQNECSWNPIISVNSRTQSHTEQLIYGWVRVKMFNLIRQILSYMTVVPKVSITGTVWAKLLLKSSTLSMHCQLTGTSQKTKNKLLVSFQTLSFKSWIIVIPNIVLCGSDWYQIFPQEHEKYDFDVHLW